jgi:hypothetical protein
MKITLLKICLALKQKRIDNVGNQWRVPMLYISMQKCRYVVLAVCLLSSSTAAVGADGDDPSARSCGIKAVSINGVNIAPTYGTFKENSQNEWT